MNRTFEIILALAVLLVLLRAVAPFSFRIIARNINTLSRLRKSENAFWHKHIAGTVVRYLYPRVDHIIMQSAGMRKDFHRFCRMPRCLGGPNAGISDRDADNIHTMAGRGSQPYTSVMHLLNPE